VPYIVSHLSYVQKPAAMQKTHLLLLLLTIGTCSSLWAQQPAQYSFYGFNSYLWNPAAAGINGAMEATGGLRRQWVDLEGSPSSQYALFQVPVPALRAAFGLKIENDVIGVQTQTNLLLSYNYQLEMGAGILSLGASGGISQVGLDGSRVRTPEGNYLENQINHRDNLLGNSLTSGTAPLIELGAWYQSEKLSVGIAARNVLAQAVGLDRLELSTVRNFFINAQYQLPLSSRITLQPTLFIRSDLVQTQTDLGLIARYNDKFFAGSSLRGYNSNSIDALALMGGIQLNEKLSVGYAYDLSLSSLRTVSNGSHEIVLNYRIKEIGKGGKAPKIIYNPRSL
jgi:type IX secretion system PorP/SprF family membrane protein